MSGVGYASSPAFMLARHAHAWASVQWLTFSGAGAGLVRSHTISGPLIDSNSVFVDSSIFTATSTATLNSGPVSDLVNTQWGST